MDFMEQAKNLKAKADKTDKDEQAMAKIKEMRSKNTEEPKQDQPQQ